MPTAMDLVQNVASKKPSEFQTNFSELVTDRIRDLLAAKRVEVAKNLFTPPRPDHPVEGPGFLPPKDGEEFEPPKEGEDEPEGEPEERIHDLDLRFPGDKESTEAGTGEPDGETTA